MTYMYVPSQIGLLIITTQEKLLQFIISEMYVEQIGSGGRGSREVEVRGLEINDSPRSDYSS